MANDVKTTKVNRTRTKQVSRVPAQKAPKGKSLAPTKETRASVSATLEEDQLDDEDLSLDLEAIGAEDAILEEKEEVLSEEPFWNSLSEDSSSEASLAKLDPLARYMQEIRKYPLLTREEEQQLAIRFAKTHDPKIGRKLITSNLRLVVKIAHEYRKAYKYLLDLVQEGNLGLLQAVEKYDPYRGVKLSSYAAWWIRAYMLKFILNNWRLVKIGTTQTQRKLFFNLNKEKEILEAAGFVANNELLAKRLSVPEKEIADMQLRLGAGELSLDSPLKRDEDSGKVQGDLLEADAATRPDVQLEGHQFQTMLKQKLEQFEKTLKGREQTLFRERLIAEQPLTLQEVGERYQISRERARQVEARLLARLKIYLKRELGEAVQIAMGLEG